MPKDDTKRFRYVGSVAGQLNSGRPLDVGEYVDLTQAEQDDPFNKGMIESDLLLDASGLKEGEGK